MALFRNIGSLAKCKLEANPSEDRGPGANAVLAHAKKFGNVRSVYVIQSEHGQPYTAYGIATLSNPHASGPRSKT